MSIRETETRSRPVAPPPEFDVEQEVAFGRYWTALAARWWLLLIGAVVGAAIGFAASAGGSRPYDATAIVYLGQPFAPGGTNQIQSLPTKLGFVNQLAHSKDVIRRVGAQVGIRPGVLGEN